MAAIATVVAVRALVYDTVFKRAQEIAASDKLLSVVCEGEGLLKGTAECIGSSPSDVYVLSVSIDGATAVGHCSCPAGKSAKSGLCKHVVALLLRRIQEIEGPKLNLSESPSEDLVVSIPSQNGDISMNEDGKGRGGDGATPSTAAQRPGSSTSSSKRALPAWMLGVVGSDNSAKPSASKPKSNKRAAEPKPPRPAPPPRRFRRSGQPLKISNELDEGEEVHDPGEVDDAAPMDGKNCPLPVVTEDDEGPETIDILSEGAAARERRRLRALKKEVVVAEDDGNEGVKRTRARSSKAVTKEVLDQPVRSSKRRRLAKKYMEENSDGSDNGAVLLDGDADDGFGLTDEDLMFLAQEQLEKEKATLQAEDGRTPKAPEEPVEEEKPTQNCSQGKKSSSIFSMSKWKEMSAEGRDIGADNIDWETLKSYSLGANSDSTSQLYRPLSDDTDAAHGLLPSLQTAGPAMASKDVPAPTQITTRSDEIDAVANDMLDIFFGSTQSKESVKDIPAASSGPSFSEEEKPNYCAAEAELEAPQTSFPFAQRGNVPPTVPAVADDIGGLGVELKPKKKSSLKDRVKMLLG